MPVSAIPSLRMTACNLATVRGDGAFILYWMTAQRRSGWNYALQRAVEWSNHLRRPLVVLEALRCGYGWASDRLHRFVIDGMADQAAAFARSRALYHPYVEDRADAGKGLVETLAASACVVVTDEFPCFFLPRMLAAVAPRLPVRCEAIDGNGLLPMRAADRAFDRAVDFRRHVQKRLPSFLREWPAPDPLAGLQPKRLPALPRDIAARWPAADPAALRVPGGLSHLPIDHQVGAVNEDGGSTAAARALARFLDHRLPRYADQRSRIEDEAASGLSPFLHFGQLSAHEIVATVMQREDWSPDRLSTAASGAKEGWWGMGADAESFLDELVTWRELGYGFCHHRPADYDRYESLPRWALASLEQHAADPREHLYTRDQLADGRTHDALWNAAQNELRRSGRLHNYLRMLWGKKILEWSPHPRDALATMVDLNNRYALDGRNPNSYSGMCWVLGRFDRPWAPQRPVFGCIRYMSSANTARKLRTRAVEAYVQRWAGAGDGQQSLFSDG